MEVDASVPDGAQPHQLPSDRDVRALLSGRNYRSDASIGRLPFVNQIWSRVQEPRTIDETQRGRMLRAAVWDLIEQHHNEALKGDEHCSVCAASADAADWHVLWLENTFTPRDGFERRYTHEELVALGSYAASNRDMTPISPKDAAAIRRLKHAGHLGPPESYPIKRRRGLRWYGERAGHGRQAIRVHLSPDDSRLRAALERQGVRLRDGAIPVATPVNLPVHIGRCVRVRPQLVAPLCVLLL
ncbi:MAG TPA: hypothetical protein VGP82_12815, partial [Ktedonobacterales bacterium]|nr:hypothetical protein [Ktedonobacterales bacterium]